ncbi:uncharacterized protein LY79DRAFT_537295 [Colletotrichum navitas]|uniref:Uncharacterized protein n=1 Tax=Colletotrichum navitas TaxID=681940 RepID=A0AAD8QAP6_9PEZI|nr:uncharacterized protein LY79DRAFT_537295 [Colletotrichum navitas]KAK1599190.1 hypothetical protein LY79DRAFT_537295 [Colletotrichum navitas]
MSSRRTLARLGFPVCSWGLFLSMPCKLVYDMDRLDFLETQGSGMIGAAQETVGGTARGTITKPHPTAIPAGPRLEGEGRGGKRPDDAGQAYHTGRVVMPKYHSARDRRGESCLEAWYFSPPSQALECASSRRGVDPSKWNAGLLYL